MLKIGQTSGWRSLALIHRLEYPLPLQYLCYAAWGACYAVQSAGQLLQLPVLLAITANYLLILALNALNAVVDIDTDARTSHKQEVAAAVHAVGRKRTRWWSATEMILALALCAVAAVWTERWLIVAVAVLIISLHLLYNLEPARLKRRALVNPITLGLSLGFLPGIAAYSAAQAPFTVPAWMIVAGLGVLITARTWWWSVPDWAGDTATGMMTPAARYGVTRALVVSCLVTLPGLALIGWGLSWRYGPGWGLAGVLVNLPFFATQLAMLRRDRALPTSARLRRRSVPLAIAANAALLAIPLVAG
jgi:lycopene elongase/hydratase (dihydrobisanhydrobacterioruberin-forming)